jgi:hypothetical protein
MRFGRGIGRDLIEPSASVGHAGERRGARFQRRLSAHDLFELLFELLLIEQLPAGDAIDLRAQLGDAILIGELLLLLAGNQPGQHVVVEGEIGAGRKRPAGHDHEAADRDPERDRTEPHLAAGVHQRVVGPPRTLSRCIGMHRAAGIGTIVLNPGPM